MAFFTELEQKNLQFSFFLMWTIILILYWICYCIASVLCFVCFFLFFDHKTHGILAPWPGVKPTPPALECEVLTIGQPEKSQKFTICVETQKTPNSQSNLEKEKRSWRNQVPWFQAMLQSYSHQNSMVLEQKQKYISMEQDRKSRDKPMHLWSTNLWQRRQECTMEKRQSLQ